MPHQRPSSTEIERIVTLALHEDAPWGDLTTETLVPETAQATAHLRAREPGIFCGEDLFRTAMQHRGDVTVQFHRHDGDRFAAGDTLATATGPAQSILTAERVALNFTQRLSAIATTTTAYVAATEGTEARIVDTRKTTPGLRLVERYAVRCGGGHNHRFSLSDAVLVKDNHLATLTDGHAVTNGNPAMPGNSLTGVPATANSNPATPSNSLTAALQAMKARLPHTTHVEVEVDRLDQLPAVLASGVVDTVLLDNFSLDDLRTGVAEVAAHAQGTAAVEQAAHPRQSDAAQHTGDAQHTDATEFPGHADDFGDARAEQFADARRERTGTAGVTAHTRHTARRVLVEASGGVSLDRIPAIARTGVDLISVGALTHTVRALDLGLDFAPTP